ncbi:hypothetical protein [uncultured Fibrobacter sp.]|uniref:hypothetical protein n=1 Tax=uncultured Fibrobacter sp. TaxID=261512 RepID=UPI002595279D|nr:hypothetical protein [uncultured Fibrobacter sp.]
MNHQNDKNISTNTNTNGYNIRVTARTKDLAEKLQAEIAEKTGANKPLGAIVGELVFEKSKEFGIE